MTDFSVPYGTIFLNVHIVNALLSELSDIKVVTQTSQK